MNIVLTIIFERRIDNTLWPEILLAITHIKNLRPTQVLEGFMNRIKMQNQAILDLHHFIIFVFNVYVLLHKKKQSLNSAKQKACALRKKLIGFDGYKIYCVYIKDQNKVIRAKNLQIYTNISSKLIAALPDFENILTFDVVQIQDEQTPSKESSAFKKEKNAQKKLSKKPARARAVRRKDRALKKENKSKTIPQRQSQTRKTIRPTTKPRKDIIIHILVMQLTRLPNNWKYNTKVSVFPTSCYDQSQESAIKALESKDDSLQIFAISIPKTNAANPTNFLSLL